MATVTIGGVDYTSYTTVEWADHFLAADVQRAAPWALRSADSKARGLVSATRMLLTLPWCEEAPDPAVDPAPEVVQEVTAMLASDLLSKPKLFADASGSSNIKIAKAGSAQVEFFAPVEGGPPIPRSLWDRLSAAGLVCLSNGDDDGSGANDGAFVSGICGGYRPLGGRWPWDWPIAEKDYD